MTRAIVAGILALATIVAASEAFALSLSVDVPVQFTFSNQYFDTKKGARPKDSTSSDVSGFILGASAGWLGVGYEKYDVGMKGTNIDASTPSTFDATFSYQMYDIFLDLPFPVIHPVVGYGKGTLNVSLENTGVRTTVEPADVSQVFLRLGIAIGPLLDLHLGYHKLTAEDAKIGGGGGGGPDKLHGSGETITVGVRAGW